MAAKTRQIRSRGFWERTGERFAASGLSQRKFARMHGLDQSTLARWVRKLREEEEEARARGGLVEVVESAQANVAELPAPTAATSATAKLQCGALSLEFSELPSASYLVALFREAAKC